MIKDKQESKDRFQRHLEALQFYRDNCADFMCESDMQIMAERDIEYEDEY